MLVNQGEEEKKRKKEEKNDASVSNRVFYIAEH